MRHATSLRRPPAPPSPPSRPSKRDAAIFNRATSRQRPPSPTWPCGPPPRGGEASDRMRAYGGGKWAGESSRKPRRPRPYSRAFAGISLRFALRPKCRPWPPPCAYHATPRASHLWDPMVFTTPRCLIATQRATSLQTPFLHMRMRAPPPPCAYHATHGDLGFYNDAARRVATVFE